VTSRQRRDVIPAQAGIQPRLDIIPAQAAIHARRGVTPAQAGVQGLLVESRWIPACAGMTTRERSRGR